MAHSSAANGMQIGNTAVVVASTRVGGRRVANSRGGGGAPRRRCHGTGAALLAATFFSTLPHGGACHVVATGPTVASARGHLAPGAPASLHRPAETLQFEEDFERLELLGRGGFGEVWRCRLRSAKQCLAALVDHEECAVKVVRLSVATGGRNAAAASHRALREAQFLAAMDHPNIMKYQMSWLEAGWGEGDDCDCALTLQTSEEECCLMTSRPGREGEYSKELDKGLGGEWGERGEPHSIYDADASGSSVVFMSDEPSFPTHDNPSGGVGGSSESLSEREPRSFGGLSPAKQTRESTEPFHTNTQGGSSRCVATLFIATELCRNDTLKDWIAARASWIAAARRGASIAEGDGPWALEGLSIFCQCVHALDHLHSRGCVHRDIKPSNVLFGQDGIVRLCDFGLAKALPGSSATIATVSDEGPLGFSLLPGSRGGAQATEPTSSGRTLVGTPSYAAPEQLSGGLVGSAADVYSLGLVLVELLCPVQTHMERAKMFEGLRVDRTPPAACADAASPFPVLAHLAVRMTHPDAQQRPTANDILDLIPEVHTQIRPLRTAPAPPPTKRPNCRRASGKAASRRDAPMRRMRRGATWP